MRKNMIVIAQFTEQNPDPVMRKDIVDVVLNTVREFLYPVPGGFIQLGVHYSTPRNNNGKSYYSTQWLGDYMGNEDNIAYSIEKFLPENIKELDPSLNSICASVEFYETIIPS